MKRALHCVLAAAAASALSMTVAHAGEPADIAAGHALVQNDGCFTCHAVDSVKIGPSFRSIAAQFGAMPGDKGEHMIEHAVRHGVSGTMMMAHPSISAADLDKIADWTLAQKPAAKKAANASTSAKKPAAAAAAAKVAPAAKAAEPQAAKKG